MYKTLVSFAGDNWTESRSYKDFYRFHRHLIEKFPNDEFLAQYDFEALDKSHHLSGSEKKELSHKRLEFLKEYMKDLSKVYYSSTEYLKLIFD